MLVCPANDMQSHQRTGTSNGQANQGPGTADNQQMTNCQVSTGIGLNLIFDKASTTPWSMLTTASICIPISKIDNADTSMCIHFDNPLLNYHVTSNIPIIKILLHTWPLSQVFLYHTPATRHKAFVLSAFCLESEISKLQDYAETSFLNLASL